MKTILLPFTILSMLLGMFVFGIDFIKTSPSVTYEKQEIPICGPVPNGPVEKNQKGKFIAALPGWGKYSYKISTTSDSAQFYFDQGLNMYYSYHMKEALASFMESSRFDPRHPMTYWGQALAMGPYYNAAHTYLMPAGIKEVLQKMNQNTVYGNGDELSLISAMNFRYSDDLSDANRQKLNAAYAQAMRALIHPGTSNLNIKALYVDAVMLMHAWDFWKADGSAKPWTEELIFLCESILKKDPQHPAALHYHIHLTEASKHPEAALPNADKLKDLFPGVAHMVHMSSHEYQRNGLYAKGVEVNDLADKNLLKYDSLAGHLALNKHSAHYFAVQTYCAMTGAMYEKGMHDALRVRKSVAPTPANTYDQYLYMMPELTLVRLGKWKEILKDTTKPDNGWAYSRLLLNFSKGMAYANTGDAVSAKKEMAALLENSKDPILKKRRIPFNAPLPMAQIAGEILNANILFYEKNYPAALKSLEKAIVIEDQLIYTEPNDWPIPARHFLGAFLLKTGKAAAAETVFKEDLIWNPGNGWSLVGLSQSLKAQQKTGQLAELKTKYMQAFSKADVIPTSAVFIK